MFGMLVNLVFMTLFVLSTDAAPLLPDTAPAVTDILCSAKFPAGDTPDLDNLHTCLTEHHKDSDTAINIDSVRVDDQLRELEVYLPGEANGNTIQINCQSDETYQTSTNNDDDILEFDCHLHAKLIVRGLVKNPAETANREKHPNLICSSKHCQDWINCPYAETEIRPSDIDFQVLGEECFMIGGKATGRRMYNAHGSLDCLWCRPFSNYDFETKTCKACTTGGLPYPTPPNGYSCQAATCDILTASTNFAFTSAAQTSATATTFTPTTPAATEKEDLSTPAMHGLPYTTVEPENSAGTTDATTDKFLQVFYCWLWKNHVHVCTGIIIIIIIVMLILICSFSCLRSAFCSIFLVLLSCCGKYCNSTNSPGVRGNREYSSVST